MLKKIATGVALCMLLGVPAVAGGADDEQQKIFPFDYAVEDLPNGLRVIVVPTDYPNIVSLQIPVQVGSRNEVEPGKSGFAHFFEHVMFRGTENYSAEEYQSYLKNAGADQNAYTSDDLTNYHTTFSKEDLEKILELEADRFQNLKYAEEDFKTEARAVLGEYNKNFANPVRRILEAQREAAFEEHTYEHTTMGFIEDIENMPNQYDYSLEFFDRYYRPEYATIVVTGDVQPQEVFRLVRKYWGGWERGDFQPEIPAEPAPDGPVYEHVKWDSPTLPWVTVAFHGPAFSDTAKDMVAMDIVQAYAFTSSSPLYQKLVIQEQKVDQLWPYFPDRKDPYLLTVAARVKDQADMAYVRDEILKAFARARTEKIAPERLEAIKGNLKYSFANRLDNSEAIADALVNYVALTRDPEAINRVYRMYDSITPEEVQTYAGQYFTDDRLVVTTLASADLAPEAAHAGSVDRLAAAARQELETVLLQTSSPIVNFRVLFNVGAVLDPEGKEGLANLTAAVIAGSGSQQMTYEQIQEAFFPMAAGFGAQVDKEMTVFTGTVHKDNLDEYYRIVGGQLLEPGWREEDFRRVKTNLINAVKVNLRDNNDEELGKEVLYEMIYRDHPYGHLNYGWVDSLEALTLEDVREFYRTHYTQANLVLGLAGDYPDEFLARLRADLRELPAGSAASLDLPEPESFEGYEAVIVQKDTRATAISFGFPIEVNRTHEDFVALWLIRSYFGEHRSTNSHLFQRLREVRGLNYGDYAYIEYFPSGMFQFHPDPNLGRRQQIFQVWIRPVVPEHGHFSIRAAMFELVELVREGMSEEDFEATRNYLLKFVNILTKTQDRQLGYQMDSRYYGIPEFTKFVKQGLENLTLEEVNRVLRDHLQTENIKFAIIAKDAEDLRRRLVEGTPSPIEYDAPKPQDVLAEDEVIQTFPLPFEAERVRIVPLEEVFTSGGEL